MVFLAAVAAVIAPSPPSGQPVSATAQATATIRVISAVRIRLNGERNPGLPQPRIAILRLNDGSTESAKLIEFQ
jgi:hypothetical protein